MLPVEIYFFIRANSRGSLPYEVKIDKGTHEKWVDPETQEEMYIIGRWLGSFIHGKVVSPGCTEGPLRHGVTPEELILGGFGQFILVVNSREGVSVYTSKTMFSIYWMATSSHREYVFSSNPEHLAKHRERELTINVLEVAWQTELFYRSPFDTILKEVKMLAFGEKLVIGADRRFTENYLSDLLWREDWTIYDAPSQIPYLDPWIAVLQQTRRKVILLLSGGIDSTILLLKLKKAGITVRPIVISQYYDKHYSALTEVVQSNLIADLVGIPRDLIAIDTLGASTFNSGKSTGWKWGYAYYSQLHEVVRDDHDEWLVVSGMGDCLVGIKHTGYRLLAPSIRHPVNHLIKGLERFLFSDLAAQMYLLKKLPYGVLPSMDTSCWHPLVISAFGAPYIPAPLQRNRRNIFWIFPQLENDLVEYRRKRVLERLFPGDFRVGTPEELISSFRLLRYYLHLGAAAYSYGVYISQPYIDAFPWLARKTLGLKEIIHGKWHQHRYFKQETNKDFRHYTSSRRHDYRRIGLSELSNAFNKPACTFDLSAGNWYAHEKFRGFTQKVMQGGVCLLDMLEDGPVRAFYERLVRDVLRGDYSYVGEHQPKHLVNFLRFEMFLRDVI